MFFFSHVMADRGATGGGSRLCEKVRLAFFFVSLSHFDFFNLKTGTLKCFQCELKMFIF